MQKRKQWSKTGHKYALENMNILIFSGIIAYIQVATAAKRVWRPPILVQNLTSYNQNNQLVKFDKISLRGVSSISEE